MMDAQAYLPAESFSTMRAPEDLTVTPDMAIRSGMVSMENLPRPGYSPRLPGVDLDAKYQAWEQAKTSSGEILEQFMASRYYHGKQWTDAEIRELKKRKQPVTTKNRIKRKVDFLVGVEQRLRRDPKCFPRTPNADHAAYVSTAALRSVEDETKWQSISSAATKDALIRGIGVVWQGARVVKGKAEVRKSHIPSDRFFYDPCSEQWDFSDARYVGEWQWLDIDQAAEIMPFAAPLIKDLAKADATGTLTMLPQEFVKIQNRQNWINARRNLIRIVHIWYRYAGNWMYDYLSGPICLCPEEYDCKSPYIGEDDQTQHPYNAWSPYIDESGNRYGVVRDMMPLQDEINKRTSKMLYLLTVRQTRGESGAVTDVDAMKQEMAKPDGHVVYNKGFEFDIIDQTAQTQGQFELLQESKAEIENLGPNPGLIGRGVENQSGRAILAQQNSGMTELSPVFEMKREWELKVYHSDWRLIRQFWANERYVRVTADPKAVEFLSVNRVVEDPITGQVHIENAMMEMDVDVLLDQGPDTVTMREELLAAISDRPDVPLELILELSSLPDKDVVLKRLQELREPPPELVAMQDRMAKLESALKASQIDESIANVENKRAATVKALVESGAPPDVLKAFPLSYGKPSTLDRLQGATAASQNTLLQAEKEDSQQSGPEGQEEQPGLPGGQNALMPQGQPALPGEETQVGGPGGLPLGPGVGQ